MRFLEKYLKVKYYFVDRKFIERPLTPAPPPIITVHKAGGYSGYSSTTTQGHNYSSSTTKYNASSSSSYKVSRIEEIINLIKVEIGW